MNMLNQAAVEALCSATYLENYLETMENLPDDLQRSVSQLRELDIQCRGILNDIDCQQELYKQDGAVKKKSFFAIQRALIRCQEIGDEKLTLLSVIIDFIENRTRQLEQDRENLDPGSTREQDKEEVLTIHVPPPKKESKPSHIEPVEKVEKAGNKRQRRQKNHDVSQDDIKDDKEKAPKKKKKRKVKKERDDSPVDQPIDPDEPTYCLCNQVSYGEMIGCDNDKCVIEWFHFNCVGLTYKPKGKWYCPNCRGDKPTVKKPDK
ncbi:inhibitor of growth protein 1-like [Gigantopelta aegis]|uniref:inhibitor of growth protein 1-like n=1 Tax=Gigantopelta aegis TaxID=1735272 RepID=UPI001B88E538|nr:inhibitor of growth protein 1-like [Gigantopelta aegis]